MKKYNDWYAFLKKALLAFIVLFSISTIKFMQSTLSIEALQSIVIIYIYCFMYTAYRHRCYLLNDKYNINKITSFKLYIGGWVLLIINIFCIMFIVIGFIVLKV